VAAGVAWASGGVGGAVSREVMKTKAQAIRVASKPSAEKWVTLILRLKPVRFPSYLPSNNSHNVM